MYKLYYLNSEHFTPMGDLYELKIPGGKLSTLQQMILSGGKNEWIPKKCQILRNMNQKYHNVVDIHGKMNPFTSYFHPLEHTKNS